jgi:hypothetical protein
MHSKNKLLVDQACRLIGALNEASAGCRPGSKRRDRINRITVLASNRWNRRFLKL